VLDFFHLCPIVYCSSSKLLVDFHSSLDYTHSVAAVAIGGAQLPYWWEQFYSQHMWVWFLAFFKSPHSFISWAVRYRYCCLIHMQLLEQYESLTKLTASVFSSYACILNLYWLCLAWSLGSVLLQSKYMIRNWKFAVSHLPFQYIAFQLGNWLPRRYTA